MVWVIYKMGELRSCLFCISGDIPMNILVFWINYVMLSTRGLLLEGLRRAKRIVFLVLFVVIS